MTARIRARPVRTAKLLKPAALSIDALTIALGVACSFTVHLVGELPITEAVLLFLLPILVALDIRKILRPGLRPIFLLMGVWLAGQVATDIYRSTATVDWMRSDANIVFFAVDLACLAVLIGRIERRKIFFMGAFAVGSLLSARFQPTLIIAQDPWKFGYSTGVMLMVVLLSCFFYNRRWYPVVLLLLAGMAVINLLMNFRTPVLSVLLTLVLVVPVVPERFGRLRLLPRVGTRLRVVVLAAMALGAGFAAVGLLHLVTASGLAGQDAKLKNESQSRSSGGILIGGRPEILISSRAVIESPIIGYGSWAKDLRFVEMLHDFQAEHFIKTDLQDEEDQSKGLIPTHSHIMGAWVWAGILGTAFWAYVLWLVLRAIMQVSVLRPRNAPLYAWLFVGLAWDILFSPFASTRRVTESIILIIIIDLAESGAPALEVMKRRLRPQLRRLPSRWSPPRVSQPR
jgi:hypothetical protein